MEKILMRGAQASMRSTPFRGAGFLLAAAAGATMLAACQTTPPAPTGNLLTAAGFTMKVADTPKRQAKLAALPIGKMISRSIKGKNVYVYADPKGCNCVYVGDDVAYQSYMQLGRNRSVPSENLLIAEMNSENDWDFNSIGPGPNW